MLGETAASDHERLQVFSDPRTGLQGSGPDFLANAGGIIHVGAVAVDPALQRINDVAGSESMVPA